MALVAVYTPWRQQTHHMGSAATFLKFFGEGNKLFVTVQRAVCNRLINARQVLQHDTPAAQIHMAHFRIAHLPVGQANGKAAGLEPGARGAVPQSAIVGRFGELDGIVCRLFAVSPAIEDAQYYGFRRLCCLLTHGVTCVSSKIWIRR